MRCPTCNKFVSFGDGTVDDVDLDIDEDSGQVTVSGRVALPCIECDEELKELNIDDNFETYDVFETSIVTAIKANIPSEYHDKVTEEWIESSDGGTDPLAAKCKVKYELDGDPDKTFSEEKRKSKVYKGVTVSGTVKRTIHVSIPGSPGTEIVDDADYEHTIAELASAFDELT